MISAVFPFVRLILILFRIHERNPETVNIYINIPDRPSVIICMDLMLNYSLFVSILFEKNSEIIFCENTVNSKKLFKKY